MLSIYEWERSKYVRARDGRVFGAVQVDKPAGWCKSIAVHVRERSDYKNKGDKTYMEGEIVLKVKDIKDEIKRLSEFEGKSEYAKGKKDVLVGILWSKAYVGGR